MGECGSEVKGFLLAPMRTQKCSLNKSISSVGRQLQ